MDTYRDGSQVELSIEFVDGSGAAMVPTSASYTIINEFEEVIVEAEPIVLSGQTSETITVGAALNNLNGQARSIRTVRVTYSDAEASYPKSVRYMLEADVQIVIAESSFQTYEKAVITAMDVPGLTAWDLADEPQRTTALKQAYANLCKLNYVIEPPKDVDWMAKHYFGRISISDIGRLTAADLAALPDYFIASLHRAQVTEADVLLGGDAVGERRRDGLMSSSVGEISQMFRPGKPIMLPVSNRALAHLSGFISWSMSVGRS